MAQFRGFCKGSRSGNTLNKSEKKRNDNIAKLGCVLCYYMGINDTPAELHHVRRFGGKRSLAPILPLCTEHHRGSTGVHGLGAKAFEKHHQVEFNTLLDIVESKLQGIKP
jgi:hypothetical protein